MKRLGNPLKIGYYIKNYWRRYWYDHKITLLDCLKLWYIIEGKYNGSL